MKILIADDEENVRKLLSIVLEESGHQIELAKGGKEAVDKFDETIDLVLLDIRMPEMDGLQVLQHLKNARPDVPVILMTAYAGVDTAVTALKSGAFDYIIKPFDLDEIQALVAKALQYKKSSQEENFIIDKLELYDEEGNPQRILTSSPVMMELCRQIAKVSQTNATVLITGESGTGKELVAKAIYHYSERAAGPFIKINCGALPESLLESTLFGHEKGAFTGAQSRQQGLFERAHNGTLFLDEVGEMSTNLQVKLLRVLQEKEFEPIGSSKTIKTDFRLIAATNRNLAELVEENKFRLDLFYRLNVMPLVLPPLRERPEDITLLARHFVQKFCVEHQHNFLELDESTIKVLKSYTWPGNVRELSNTIEHAVIMSTGLSIYPDDLPPIVLGESKRLFSEPDTMDEEGVNQKTLRESMKNYECSMVREALKKHNGNRERTAKALGISKRALMYKIQEYQIEL
ncbi:MAG: sigma 54-interacting transcriptional regulator [Neisseria animaloris]|uniref:Transcriptional regulator n=1 Tax=Neisseria animaloris TaxID=326522 RepID=A0A448UCW8_9NEIS|nr:sigma 54-interacting transcriptional regulator [Neisseria animaloris]MDO5073713.1 sigma 54-interacting transcriptional regulator [Neisseria animaloris]VEJ21733.1 transcriptional regulator [Neisseria animaloris]